MSQTQTNPTLVVTGGDLDGTSFVVLQSAQELLLGSSQDCHFQILLGNVEAVHAKVGWGPKGLLLSDALSSSGTYVNGEKIAEEHPLTDGDRISLGPPGAKTSCKLLVRVPAGAALPGEDLVLLKPETGLQVVPPFEAEEASSVPEAKAAHSGQQAPGATEKSQPPAPGPPATPPVPTPEERKAKAEAAKPDYVTEPPSIAPGRPSARPAARTAAKPAAKPKAAARSRLPLYLVIAVALGGGLFFAFRTFLRSPPEIQSAAPAR
ncbi:MAG TPA: FHA domain-containing protein, partial [Vicinamibacteria bacterium]